MTPMNDVGITAAEYRAHAADLLMRATTTTVTANRADYVAQADVWASLARAAAIEEQTAALREQTEEMREQAAAARDA